MLHSRRSYVEGKRDYNDIAVPTPKRRKICTVEGTSLDNPYSANELHTENPVSAGNSLPEFYGTASVSRASIYPSALARSISNDISAGCLPAQATEAGDVVESNRISQKICFGMVSFYN